MGDSSSSDSYAVPRNPGSVFFQSRDIEAQFFVSGPHAPHELRERFNSGTVCVLRKGEITIHNSVSQSASLAGFSSDAHIVVETFFLRSRQDTSQIQIQGSSRFGVSAVRAAK